MKEELKQAFESWFNRTYPLPAGIERGSIGRDHKKCCNEAFVAGADQRPSPWIPASTPPKKDGLYSCLVKYGTEPRSYNFKHGKWQTPGTEVIYYMPIPPLPEKTNE